MDEKRWFAVYTRPRYEKKIEKLLLERNIQCYLPLIKTLRQWSDRKKWVEMPLFNSYVFVNTDSTNRYEILNLPGVVRFVSFEGIPVTIPEEQIENIRWILSSEIPTQSLEEKIPEGSKVEIIKGPLRGLRAEMVQYNNRKKIVLRLDHLETSLEIQIPENHVKVLVG